MIMSVEIREKSFGHKSLYENLYFDVQEGEKIGLIGRNGTGKSTLLNIITGEDKDYDGEVNIKRGTVVVNSRQEHQVHESKTVLEYIQGDLPEYDFLIKIIDSYPLTTDNSQNKLQEFTDAIERFSQLGYYQIEDEIKRSFKDYQIDSDKLHRPFQSLSGGERRMVELIKVQRSRGHLALIDEPTNHMDYVAKSEFIKWLQAAKESVVVITHDRDVLTIVDRIIEIRDNRCFSFKGNYNAYLKTNTNQVSNQVNEYELSQRRLINLEDDLIRFRKLKEKARDPGTIHRFKSQELKTKSLIKTLRATPKPSFWIDQESASGMNDKLMMSYEKHKAQNIKLGSRKKIDHNSSQQIIKIDNLSLGYQDEPLFDGISFIVRTGERLRLHGRNGTGKSTIVKAIMSQINNTPLQSKCFKGSIELDQAVKVGLYEQEINHRYLTMTLNKAIEELLRAKGLPISDQRIKQLMSDYLFNPMADGLIEVSKLSGGQKARIQLISMLADEPQLLILDEPTNHLDLPSIEELENTLKDYHGAIIYISHDSFFSKKMGGASITIEPL